MELVVDAGGRARWGARVFRCALGRSGVRPDKREGDGATPVGIFAMRRVLYRPDRLMPPPPTLLPSAPLDPTDGWCDDPEDASYNRLVRLPYAARHERLWREDGIYDLLVVLGYNDDPVVPALGSAIFLHVARPDFAPTQGCVALLRDDLAAVLAAAAPGDTVRVIAPRAWTGMSPVPAHRS